MKRILLGILFIFLTGCTSQKQYIRNVLNDFENLKRGDGAEQEEAVIIAKKELIDQNVVRIYNIEEPRIVEDLTNVPDHQQYWFVSFKEKQASSIPFLYLVAVEKATGNIKFSDDYPTDKSWIVEAAFYNAKSLQRKK